MEQFKVIQMPFSPLLLTTWSDTDDMDELFIAPRDYGPRQAYLRSYTFTRPESAPTARDKVKHSLLRLKAAAWAVVAGHCRLPLRARLLKEKVLIRSQHHLRNGVQLLRPACAQMPKCRLAA